MPVTVAARERHGLSSTQALGYICEEMGAIHDDVLSQEEINSVLTAVVQVLIRFICPCESQPPHHVQRRSSHLPPCQHHELHSSPCTKPASAQEQWHVRSNAGGASMNVNDSGGRPLGIVSGCEAQLV